MKIIKLKAENIKKLKAIEITPKGNVVKITGKNAQGKTSILDSILYALAGGRNLPDKVLRDGETSGKIEIDLGDYQVTRSFTENNTYLKVTTKEGAEFTKGQAKLSELIGELSFDPLEFAQYDSKKQKETLIELLGIDTTKLDSEYEQVFEERREIGVYGKQAKGELESIQKPENEDIERVDVAGTSKMLDSLRSEYDEVQTHNKQKRELNLEIEALEDKLSQLNQQAKKLEKINVRDEGEIFDEMQKLSDKIKSSEEINRQVDSITRFKEAEAKIKKYRDMYKVKTEVLSKIKSQKDKMISDAKMPIEGLSFDENGVLFNGIAFTQLSSAEKLKVSMAMAMSMNPELRIVRILDGSLLDSENMKVIEEMVSDNDYQAWIEVVDESGEIGFYIEDGEVKHEQ